jgi:hypothetical protein
MENRVFIMTVVLSACLMLWSIPAPGASDKAVTPNASEKVEDINTPPEQTVKLIFIHHSCGENWLSDADGGLGMALRDNNYYVSDTNYGWGPDGIGDNTDIGHWWTWFIGPNSNTYLDALYTEYGDHSYNYSHLTDPDPNSENEVIMFKSCFPNSYLGGNTNDPATVGDNPLRGQPAYLDDLGAPNPDLTVANAKGIYNDILDYFALNQDKLFIVVTAPPLGENDTDAEHAANARAFNSWLVFNWLSTYPYNNVAVFNFFHVLTSNGGDTNTNDAGQEQGNHHRWWNGSVQHLQTVINDYSAYGSDAWDSHPTAAGNEKATDEFVPLLNVFYNTWKGSTVAEGNTDGNLPTNYSLEQNFPNPFNASTRIRFSLPRTTVVELRVYDLLGKEVELILSEQRQAGIHEVVWSADDAPSGIYLVRLEAGEYTETKKLILQK